MCGVKIAGLEEQQSLKRRSAPQGQISSGKVSVKSMRRCQSNVLLISHQ